MPKQIRWTNNYWDNPEVVGEVQMLKNIGNAVRIVKTISKEYPYEVQFTPIFNDGTIDTSSWGPHSLGPGSVSSEFKSLSDAKKFISGVKKWKPKHPRDDGLEHTQQLIKKINKW